MHRSHTTRTALRLRRALLLACAAASVLLLLPNPAAHGENRAIVWTPPTRPDNAHFSVKVGASLALTLAASASRKGEIAIDPVLGLPPGATVSTYRDRGKTWAVFRWRPTAIGDYTLRFRASVGPAHALPRTYVIRVRPNVRYPRAYALADEKLAHWANVLRRTVVRSQPRSSSAAVTVLDPLTPDHTQNLVLVLGGVDLSPTKTWYRVRLAILPNNSTGWVPRDALDDLVKVDTHLYIDRARFTIVLERDGAVVFRSKVGVGRSFWPTPRGEFYVREKLTSFNSPAYGPIAFGTSARSPTLIDWPGGGVVGIHGTNQPELLPGKVSHGCIRMRNADILKLAHLMKVGTPLTVR